MNNNVRPKTINELFDDVRSIHSFKLIYVIYILMLVVWLIYKPMFYQLMFF